MTTEDLLKMIDQLKSDGMIANNETANMLKMHLQAVQQFERKQSAEKVFKHMDGFLDLLNRQYQVGDISEQGYQQLKIEAKSMQQQW
ncbi:FIMAH domain-containing protein [Virgibacillus halophilus]|uniref:FIMAH domain-containing protein n=1 Tax=Tigheibacillus halophilus TaxID=361280 RepID=UPI0036391F53